MTPLFTINFRREAYQRELARARNRVVSLGLWLAYFGVLSVVLGLYGLNCTSLAQRTRMVERQASRLKALRESGQEWRPATGVLNEVEAHVADVRSWRDKLERLPQLLPANGRITSFQYNPEGVSGATGKLVITGRLRVGAGQDRMQSVMGFVNALGRDSVFARSWSNVRLVTTRALDSGDGAEFVVECQ